MIQRKQTLYLLFSGLLMLIPLYLPMFQVLNTAVEEGSPLSEAGIKIESWEFVALNCLIVLLSFVAIFLYNKRTLQMRMTMFNLLLKVGFYAYALYRIFSFHADFGSCMEVSVTVWAGVPLICMILDYLAHRAIAIDDRTIRYMDRLR